jgi:hypothetical protein
MRVYGYLTGVREGHISALRVYLQFITEKSRYFLFDWIMQILKELSKEEIKSFSDVIVEHIGELIQLDQKRARQVIMMIPNVGMNTIEHLKAYPDLQITYLENLLHQENQIQISPDLKLTYLRLLCIYQPSKVSE